MTEILVLYHEESIMDDSMDRLSFPEHTEFAAL